MSQDAKQGTGVAIGAGMSSTTDMAEAGVLLVRQPATHAFVDIQHRRMAS